MHPGSAFERPPYAVAPPFADPNGMTIYPNDVGPLLGQLAAMQDQQPLDEATQALWSEAVSRALTGQVSEQQH